MGQLQQRGQDDGDDLGIELVGLEGLAGDDGDEVVYDLDGWPERDRGVLRERLEAVGVPHRWEGESVVVAAADETWAARVLDQVEEALSLELDEDVEQVAYDLSEWEDAARQALAEGLFDEAIPHGWDGDELFVHEIDEQRVDELVEAIVDPDAELAAAEDGQQLMSALFDSAERLRRDADDSQATIDLAEAVRRAFDSEPPYGLDRAFWSAVQQDADALTLLVGAEAPHQELVTEAAAALVKRLRPYV